MRSGRGWTGWLICLATTGSAAWSAAVTPAFQTHAFFVRGKFSLVRAASYTPGYAFGPAGRNRNQPREAAEAGFLF